MICKWINGCVFVMEFKNICIRSVWLNQASRVPFASWAHNFIDLLEQQPVCIHNNIMQLYLC